MFGRESLPKIRHLAPVRFYEQANESQAQDSFAVCELSNVETTTFNYLSKNRAFHLKRGPLCIKTKTKPFVSQLAILLH